MEQRLTDIENRLVIAKKEGVREDRGRVWGQQMQTII